MGIHGPWVCCASPTFKFQSGARVIPTTRVNDLTMIDSGCTTSTGKKLFVGTANVVNLAVYLTLVLNDGSKILFQVPMGMFNNTIQIDKDEEVSLDYGDAYWQAKKHTNHHYTRTTMADQTIRLLEISSDLKVYKAALKKTMERTKYPHTKSRVRTDAEKAYQEKCIEDGIKRNKEAQRKQSKATKHVSKKPAKKARTHKATPATEREDRVLIKNYHNALSKFLKYGVPLENFQDLKRVDYTGLLDHWK